MCLELGNLFRGIVIVNTYLEIIRAAHNPVLACDESTSSNRYLGELERLDGLLRLVRPDVDVA
jgi:hypothetical protein